MEAFASWALIVLGAVMLIASAGFVSLVIAEEKDRGELSNMFLGVLMGCLFVLVSGIVGGFGVATLHTGWKDKPKVERVMVVSPVKIEPATPH